MSHLLVTGSIALDRISVFRDRFSRHILANQIHQLNVSFMVQDMVIHHGGTGGNIAYNLSLLGIAPLLMGTAGYDAADYMKKLERAGIRLRVKTFPNKLTAHANIMTDLDDNQITGFYAGAMAEASKVGLSSIKESVELAIIAPNDIRAMIQLADACFKKGIPFIADPGQGIPAFAKKELQDFVTGAHILIANDYEWTMLKDKTGFSQAEVLSRVNYLIVTYGGKGSKIWDKQGVVAEIPACRPSKVLDPTGCGDAYRAGLMFGIKNGLEIKKAARIGSWIAAKCVENKGTQNHKIPRSEFKKFLLGLQN